MATNTTAHTPGPWTVHDRTRSRDNRIMVLHPDGERLIADTGQGCSSPTRGPISEEEREANARLIAAAPEMLETLEQAYRLFGVPDSDPLKRFAMVRTIRETVNKAKGE